MDAKVRKETYKPKTYFNVHFRLCFLYFDTYILQTYFNQNLKFRNQRSNVFFIFVPAV